MSIYTRYFRVTSGPLLELAKEIAETQDQYEIALKSLGVEIGASGYRISRGSLALAGFSFDRAPDPTVWKKADKYGVHMPKANCKASAAIRQRIKELPTPRSYDEVAQNAGLHPVLPVLIDYRRGVAYFVKVFGAPLQGVLFIGVPWQEQPPTSADAREHLKWHPTPEMQEFTRGEVERAIEEINAQIRGRNNEGQS